MSHISVIFQQKYGKKLRAGTGAEATVLARFIHPSKHIRNKHVNRNKQWKQTHKTSVLLIAEEERKVQKKNQLVYTFRSEDYPNKVLYTVQSCVKVTKSGAPKGFFREKGTQEKTGMAATLEAR